MTMQVVVELNGRVSVADTVDDADTVIEAHLDDVMEALLDLDAADASITANIRDRSVTFSVMVEAVGSFDAINQASVLFRTAIHAAGGGTAEWPSEDHEAWCLTSTEVRSGPVDDEQRELVGA